MEKQCHVAFQVIPKVSDNLHSYDVVDAAIAVVEKSGYTYEVGAMETTMEGPLHELLEVVKEAQEACIVAGAKEVITNIKIHYRPETGVTMHEKLHKYRP
ncbi:MAG: thiamine-binding protein [Bacilli bacterium]